LRAFYLAHNPEKVGDAEQVARLFVGREADLNEKLRSRYSGKDLSSVRGLPEPPPRLDAPTPRPINTTWSSSSDDDESEE